MVCSFDITCINGEILRLQQRRLNPTKPSVHKMVKHSLKFLQHFLRDFERMFDHFVYTRRYRVKLYGAFETHFNPACSESSCILIRNSPLAQCKSFLLFNNQQLIIINQ